MKKLYLKEKSRIYTEFYHDKIDRLMVYSDILNSGNKLPGLKMKFLGDKTNIRSELAVIKGSGNSKAYEGNDGNFVPCKLRVVKESLTELDTKFKTYQKQRVKEGHEKPETMPLEMLKKYLTLQAEEYVLNLEVEELEKRLKKFSDREQEIDDVKLTNIKPEGRGKMRDGVLSVIDGMRVSEFIYEAKKDPVLIIDDVRTKEFDGHLVSDYREHIVKVYLEAKDKKLNQIRKEFKAKGIRLDTVPIGELHGSNVPIPTFPKECVNYKKVLAPA